MKKIKPTSKNNFFKKLLIKIIRKIGYEIIDQSILYSPTKNKVYENNFSEINKKNIVLPLGEIAINRKIESVLIILRTFTNENNQLSVRKKRIFEKEKKEYTFRSLVSLLKTIQNSKKEFNNIKFFLKIIDDNSTQEILNKINEICKKNECDYEISNLNIENYRSYQKFSDNERMVAHNAHIFNSKDFAKNSKFDLFYFVEDDYIHSEHSLKEMIYSYEKFSTICEKDVILCPADYPYLYQQNLNSLIFVGQNNHWRSIDQTLCTYLISSKILNKHWEKYYDMITNNYSTYEQPLHEIYKEEFCFSPIPSLALHMANLNTIYGLSPLTNWKKLWEENKYE